MYSICFCLLNLLHELFQQCSSVIKWDCGLSCSRLPAEITSETPTSVYVFILNCGWIGRIPACFPTNALDTQTSACEMLNRWCGYDRISSSQSWVKMPSSSSSAVIMNSERRRFWLFLIPVKSSECAEKRKCEGEISGCVMCEAASSVHPAFKSPCKKMLFLTSMVCGEWRSSGRASSHTQLPDKNSASGSSFAGEFCRRCGRLAADFLPRYSNVETRRAHARRYAWVMFCENISLRYFPTVWKLVELLSVFLKLPQHRENGAGGRRKCRDTETQ